MILDQKHIHQAFLSTGLTPDDTVMIHGDAGVAMQMGQGSAQGNVGFFIASILNFFSTGTVVVPTFTYSATQGEVFDINRTPSAVGLFSEAFRNTEGVVRSSHPIFSVAVFGRHKERFMSASLTDCFGAETIFDILDQCNAQLLCIGCSLNRLTFAHHVEQRCEVSYRYFKDFKGKVLSDGTEISITTRYFVGNLDIDYALNLSALRKNASDSGALKSCSLGRFPMSAISTHDFADITARLLRENPYAIINEGCHRA